MPEQPRTTFTPEPARTAALVDLALLECCAFPNPQDYVNKFLRLRDEIMLANGTENVSNLSETSLVYRFVGGLNDKHSERLRILLKEHRSHGNGSGLSLQYYIDLFLEGEMSPKPEPPVQLTILARAPSLEGLTRAKRGSCSVHGKRCDVAEGNDCWAKERPQRSESIRSRFTISERSQSTPPSRNSMESTWTATVTATATPASSMYNYSEYDDLSSAVYVTEPSRAVLPPFSRQPSFGSVVSSSSTSSTSCNSSTSYASSIHSGEHLRDTTRLKTKASARSLRPLSIRSMMTTDSGTASLSHDDGCKGWKFG